jgi:CHAT domain-containing protein
VPDGCLHTLPFAALVEDDGSYLGLRYTISYTPSAGTEVNLRITPRPASDRFLGIGGVEYGAAKTGSPSQSATSQRKGLPRNPDEEFDVSHLAELPDSEEEVRTAASLVGGPDTDTTLKLGKDATETAIEQTELSSYRVIHFAVHAIADPKNPERAALLLRSDPPHSDGFLEVRKVLLFPLKTQLVVLSACETAVGQLQGEEGIANLARAFLIAGSSSVVSTLWQVNDTYSLFLMKHFYQHLADGAGKAQALRAAETDLVQEFGSDTPPLYWAGFTLMGDGPAKLQPLAKHAQNVSLSGDHNQ